eukprot:scaffold16382_cov137-Isochrysis_galbana.AAC.1
MGLDETAAIPRPQFAGDEDWKPSVSVGLGANDHPFMWLKPLPEPQPALPKPRPRPIARTKTAPKSSLTGVHLRMPSAPTLS